MNSIKFYTVPPFPKVEALIGRMCVGKNKTYFPLVYDSDH